MQAALARPSCNYIHAAVEELDKNPASADAYIAPKLSKFFLILSAASPPEAANMYALQRHGSPVGVGQLDREAPNLLVDALEHEHLVWDFRGPKCSPKVLATILNHCTIRAAPRER